MAGLDTETLTAKFGDCAVVGKTTEVLVWALESKGWANKLPCLRREKAVSKLVVAGVAYEHEAACERCHNYGVCALDGFHNRRSFEYAGLPQAPDPGQLPF